MGSRALSGFVVTVIAVSALGLVAAQGQIQSPVQGGFDDTYLVAGRLVDVDGWPIGEVNLRIDLLNLKGVRAEPLTVGTSCNGDFVGYFTVNAIEGARAKVRVTLLDTGEAGFEPVDAEQPVDVVFRRNDFIMKAPFSWPYDCTSQGISTREYWPTRVTVWGRAIHGEPESFAATDGHPVYAKAHFAAAVDVRTMIEPNGTLWPADRPIYADERGDFKYSWTFDENITEARVFSSYNGTAIEGEYDPVARVAFMKLNTGATPTLDTPAAGAVGVAVAGAVAAVVAAASLRDSRRKNG